LYGLEIYQKILIFFLKLRYYFIWAPNRHKRVDTMLVESHNWCNISSWVLFRLVFYVGDLIINRCSIYTYYVGYRTDVESPRLSTSVLEPM